MKLILTLSVLFIVSSEGFTQSLTEIRKYITNGNKRSWIEENASPLEKENCLQGIHLTFLLKDKTVTWSECKGGKWVNTKYDWELNLSKVDSTSRIKIIGKKEFQVTMLTSETGKDALSLMRYPYDKLPILIFYSNPERDVKKK